MEKVKPKYEIGIYGYGSPVLEGTNWTAYLICNCSGGHRCLSSETFSELLVGINKVLEEHENNEPSDNCGTVSNGFISENGRLT